MGWPERRPTHRDYLKKSDLSHCAPVLAHMRDQFASAVDSFLWAVLKSHAGYSDTSMWTKWAAVEQA
jgi:hypothetical protein